MPFTGKDKLAKKGKNPFLNTLLKVLSIEARSPTDSVVWQWEVSVYQNTSSGIRVLEHTDTQTT